jgi:hypothetical protein
VLDYLLKGTFSAAERKVHLNSLRGIPLPLGGSNPARLYGLNFFNNRYMILSHYEVFTLIVALSHSTSRETCNA